MCMLSWCSCFTYNISDFQPSSIQVHTCYKVITKSQLTLYLYFLEKCPCTQSTEDTLSNLPKIHHPTKLFPIISNQIEFLFSFMFFLSIQICVCVYGHIYIYTGICLYIHTFLFLKAFQPSV